MHWLAQAPSNIALIKYMGKKDNKVNLPDNPSLSYTLNNLLSTVRLECSEKNVDRWESLQQPGIEDFILSQEGQNKFLKHLARIKEYFGYQGNFLVQSSNNFPAGSGLASSASSFAALTQCALRAMSELTNKAMPSIEEQAKLSRLGSGSSCRSFYSPWALWRDEDILPLELPYVELGHQAIIISAKEKAVSSSEAHKLIKTSVYYAHREQRAEENLQELIKALQAKNWAQAYQICWREFQDMHRLFTTCEHSFSYMTEDSLKLLDALQTFWDMHGDGPLVTMDAGPNIHLLYRPDQKEMALKFKNDPLLKQYKVM
jgi:diphosphomevalonate decarboxylase